MSLSSVQGIAVKVPLYAALVALAKDNDDLMRSVLEETKRAMAQRAHEGCWRELKLLARFVAELAAVHAVEADAADTLVGALLALSKEGESVRTDALYVAAMTLLWAAHTQNTKATKALAKEVLAAAAAGTEQEQEPCEALQQALQLVAQMRSKGTYKAMVDASSFFVLRPYSAFAKTASAKTHSMGTLELHTDSAQPAKLQSSVTACVYTKPSLPPPEAEASAAPALSELDRLFYADSIHDTVAQFLDNTALCARYLTAFVPVEAHYLDAYNTHLARTLVAMLVSAPSAPSMTEPDARLLCLLLSKLQHDIPQLAAPLKAACDDALAHLDELDPLGAERLARWLATELDAGSTGREWALLVAAQHTDARDHFVGELLRHYHSLDPHQASVRVPKEVAELAGEKHRLWDAPEGLCAWPRHLAEDLRSQQLVTRLGERAEHEELQELARQQEQEPQRVADCVVKACAASYLHCVGVLNMHHAFVASVGSEALLASVWRCCARNRTLLFLLLDKMTTTGAVLLEHVVARLAAEAEEAEGEHEFPWEVLDMVVAKCAAAHGSSARETGRRAVAEALARAERDEAAGRAFAAKLARSRACHWEHLLG